ncbi:hypothetical protein ACVWWI_004013 [Bradyrhizobium sp. USDA 3686]|uniref:hypothetical protein n=1 Tax=Bradyrhizobium canariense TaxID=255045 RepID=UPI001958E5AE|nr:hypothetical protein [Bradyrhizobium canariense]MBM7482675.1 hypothetical protein [Bradyrhizobium canariense]
MPDLNSKMTQLEEFIDASIESSAELNHIPTRFMEMRRKLGTIAAIKRLVEQSEEQSGFKWARASGLLDWSLEAAVVKFPELFAGITIGYAKARLAGCFANV